MGTFTIEKNDLVLPDGKRLSFPFPIAEFIKFDDVAVLRLNVPVDKIFNENVYGVSVAGDIIWQIKARKYVYENSPYMNLSRVGSYVKAHNWDCLDLVIEPKTGAVITTVQSK